MVETERLIFRKFTLDDLPELIAIRTDPDVNKYLGGTRLQNPEALTDRIRDYIASYDKNGFGPCAMIWRATGEFIGTAGLMPLEDTGEIEVGYNMKKEFWGMGIGTEAARGWLDFGFGEAGLERIVAVAIPENTPSTRIMEKLGMRFEKLEAHYGEVCAFYAVSRDDYLNQRNAAEGRQ